MADSATGMSSSECINETCGDGGELHNEEFVTVRKVGGGGMMDQYQNGYHTSTYRRDCSLSYNGSSSIGIDKFPIYHVLCSIESSEEILLRYAQEVL